MTMASPPFETLIERLRSDDPTLCELVLPWDVLPKTAAAADHRAEVRSSQEDDDASPTSQLWHGGPPALCWPASPLGSKELCALADALRVNSHVKFLHVRGRADASELLADFLSQVLSPGNSCIAELRLEGHSTKVASVVSKALIAGWPLKRLFLDCRSRSELRDEAQAVSLPSDPSAAKSKELECSLQDADGLLLAEAVAASESLELLQLVGQFSDETGVGLGRALQASVSLRYLHLATSGMGQRLALALGHSLRLKPQQLHSLAIEDHWMQDTAGAALLQAWYGGPGSGGASIAESSINSLQLICASLGDTTGLLLVELLLAGLPLASLHLDGLSLSDATVVAMADMLVSNQRLRSLSLLNPCLCVRDDILVGGALARALAANRSLTALRLDVGVAAEGMFTAIAQSLAMNCTLESLELRGEGAGKTALQATAAALHVNTSLKRFHMDVWVEDAERRVSGAWEATAPGKEVIDTLARNRELPWLQMVLVWISRKSDSASVRRVILAMTEEGFVSIVMSFFLPTGARLPGSAISFA